MDHFDVIIVGAGLSGIGAARQLQDKCAGKTFAILEARDVVADRRFLRARRLGGGLQHRFVEAGRQTVD